MRLQTKGIGRFEVKDAELGIVTAIVSTLNVVDRDKDVILPGAIPNGARVKLSAYGHSVILDDAPPVGKGTLVVEGDNVVFNGQYFMDTQSGRDAFAVVKGLAEDGEWSIGFLNVKSGPMTREWKDQGARRVINSLEIVEVSPVFMGSNQHTETVTAKKASSEISEVMRLATLAAKGMVAEEAAALAETKVIAVVDDVQITPESVTGAAGTTAQLSATAYDENEVALTGKIITWASDTETVATVDNTGLVRFVAEGTASIIATCEDVSASASATATPSVAAQQAAAAQKQRAITDELERFQRTRRRLGAA